MNPFIHRQEEPTKPLAEQEELDETEEAEKESVEDRAAYNCQNCHGEGLIWHAGKYEQCPVCIGTGKVN